MLAPATDARAGGPPPVSCPPRSALRTLNPQSSWSRPEPVTTTGVRSKFVLASADADISCIDSRVLQPLLAEREESLKFRVAMSATEDRLRSLAFSSSAEPRFWWHRLAGSNYVPSIYSDLTEEEWQIISDWFAETSRGRELIGECAVPIMSLLQGFVLGSGVRRIVQLGTHSGYSTLLLGFFLRRMRAAHGLCTFEIGETLCRFTREWIDKAGLAAFVQVEHRSSLDPLSLACAREYLGGAPGLIFLDSSHEYSSTLAELEAWYPELAPGGLLVLHDSSEFAESFDVTGKGGVARALREWRQAHPGIETFSLNHNVRAIETPHMVYQDFCGVGLIQKPV